MSGLFSGLGDGAAMKRMEEPTRPPTFRETPEERTELEPMDDYDASPDAPSHDFVAVDKEYADPLPVTVVGPVETESTLRDWSSARYYVESGFPVQIAGKNRNRFRAVISIGASETELEGVALLRRSTDSKHLSATIPVDTQLEITHNDEVWAVCLTDAADVMVSVVSEFWVD